MTKAKMVQLISVLGLLCFMNSYSLNAAELTASDKETLAMIAAHCKANRQMLSSFECEYIRLFDVRSTFKGHFAFKDDKVLQYENIGDTNDYFQYIKNGKQLRIISDHGPKTFVLGTEGNPNVKPPTPDPWEYSGNSLMYTLDKVDLPYDMITSVKSVKENDRELIVVIVEQRLNTSPENQVDNILTMQFSVHDGYLPVKIHQSDKDSKYVSETITSKILKYDVNGKTFYLPASFSSKVYHNGQLSYTFDFNIKEETVKINPDLPDDMFWEDIQPGDIVVDKDKGIQYTYPSAGIVGAPAPDFTLESLGSKDEKVTLSQIKEKVIVLDFWATWCGPCRIIHPAIESLYKWAKENNKSVAFYAIDVKEDTNTVVEFCKKDEYHMSVLLDTDGSVFKTYKGSGIPYVIIISGGIIQNAHIGSGAEPDVLEEYIKDMIITALEK